MQLVGGCAGEPFRSSGFWMIRIGEVQRQRPYIEVGCLAARGAGPANPESEKTLAAVKTPEESAKLPFGLRAQLRESPRRAQALLLRGRPLIASCISRWAPADCLWLRISVTRLPGRDG